MEHLTATQVRQRFGGISDMTLWRWMRDERVGFPQPLVINRRRYFRAAEVEAFERLQAKRMTCAETPINDATDA